jgi:hypothetical protein
MAVGAAQFGEGSDEQPVVAQLAGGPDRPFAELPGRGDVNS